MKIDFIRNSINTEEIFPEYHTKFKEEESEENREQMKII